MSSPKPRAKPQPDGPVPVHRFTFDAIGTAWIIDIFTPVSKQTAAKLLHAIMARIGDYDAHYSRFRDDSLVAVMAATAGTYRLPEDARPLFDLYHELYSLTDGAMTPLIGQVLVDAGYGAEYSLQPKPLTTPPAWDDVLDYSYPQLRVKKPVLLDLGAAGKGYLVDIIADLLEQHGIPAYCIDAGGDIIYDDPAGRPMRIGLEHPGNASQVIGVASIVNKSLCGSAGNRRSWGAYHHIIDPHSLASPRHLEAVWVVADSTLLADALTTALFFVSAKTLHNRYTFEYAIVHNDYSLERSAGFPGEFFTSDTTKG